MDLKLRAALIVVLTFWIAASAYSRDTFERAVKAYEEADYAKAAQIWEKFAEEGHGLSQFNLANMYEYGVGVPQDMDKAVTLFRNAALNEVSDAQLKMGDILYTGYLNANRDVERAVYWWTEAGNQGVLDAQFKLGKLYSEGRHWPQNLYQANYWLNLAAKRDPLLVQPLLQELAVKLEEKFVNAEWVNQSRPEQYTVQLLSTESSKSGISFIVDNGFENAAVVTTRYGWFLVIAGLFNSYGSAHQAVQGLPGHLRDIPPHIRQMSIIQQSAVNQPVAAQN